MFLPLDDVLPAEISVPKLRLIVVYLFYVCTFYVCVYLLRV